MVSVWTIYIHLLTYPWVSQNCTHLQHLKWRLYIRLLVVGCPVWKKTTGPWKKVISKAWAFHRLPTVISFGGGDSFCSFLSEKGGTNWMFKSPSFLLSDESTHHTQLNRTKKEPGFASYLRQPSCIKTLNFLRPVLLMDTFLLMNIAVLKTRGPMFSRKKTSFGLGTLLPCLLKCTGWIYFLTQDSRGKWRCTSEFPT